LTSLVCFARDPSPERNRKVYPNLGISLAPVIVSVSLVLVSAIPNIAPSSEVVEREVCEGEQRHARFRAVIQVHTEGANPEANHMLWRPPLDSGFAGIARAPE